MAEADFYVLPAADTEARELFLCRLCEKVLGLGLPIHIHSESEALARHLDQLLWEHKPDAFLPHTLLGQAPDAPITLGWGEQRPTHQQVFINMALDLPEDVLSFSRILEIVVQTPEILEATRRNYKLYQSREIPVRMNDMRR